MRILPRLLLALVLLWPVAADAAISRQIMGNANFTATADTTAVVINQAFTAPRTLTLPFAGATNIGQSGAATYYQNQLSIYDTVNGIGVTNTLTISPQSGDTINGSSSLVVSIAGASVLLTPTGGSNWQAVVFSASGAAITPTTCGANLYVTAISSGGVGTCSGLTVGGIAISRGQFPGTNTNDAATAGNVGEYISQSVASGSAVALTTGVAANVASVSLTAGDWECSGNIVTNPNAATTSSAFFGWISTTSASFPTQPNGGAYKAVTLALAAGVNYAEPVGSSRFSLSGTTTVFLSTIVNFAVNTNSAFGFLGCWRRR